MQNYFIQTILVFTTVFCGHQDLFSQSQGLNQDYYFEERSTWFTSVRSHDGGLLIVGQSGTDSSFISSIFVLHIDTLGDIVSLSFYKDSLDDFLVNAFYYDAVYSTYDRGYLVAGNMLSANSLFIIELGDDLIEENRKVYFTEALARFTKNIYYLDDHYYITGMVSKPDHDSDVFAQKTDLQLNRIWEKTYSNPLFEENGGSAVIEDGGITLLIGEWTDPDPQEYNDTRRWTKFIHIDTAGQNKWEWRSDENEEGGSPNGLVLSGSNYLYFTRTGYQVSHTEIHFGTQIVCRDSMFNLVWRKEYSDTFAYQGFNDMVIGPDGYLYVTGQIYDEVMWGRIFKIDPVNGDVIWQARDTGLWRKNWGSRNVMEGITVLPSGSVVAVGYTWAGQGFERGFVIKATADGCIDTLCTTSTIDNYLLRQGRPVLVYPNPTSEYLIFEIEVPYDVQISIHDFHGRLLQVQPSRPGTHVVMLNEEVRQPGMYMWRVVSDDGRLLGSGKFVVSGE